ncbi:MAG TPA: hypothetical protein VGJ33_18965 [Candidatus Angelobacter sp.]
MSEIGSNVPALAQPKSLFWYANPQGMQISHAACWVLPHPNFGMKGQDEMSKAEEYTNFRIWAAVVTVVVYLFLAATGNS